MTRKITINDVFPSKILKSKCNNLVQCFRIEDVIPCKHLRCFKYNMQAKQGVYYLFQTQLNVLLSVKVHICLLSK